ncbi:MAG: phosphate signaling complex protein PhoU [Planctomycetales bacterium]|nr:phosphate signaling complex protein PhoU [bacterium]UNM06971.1 MAG: phosphate signaling complex protein PhoU [Planctomycetales bacterium]
MNRHLTRDMSSIERHILEIGGLVEMSIQKAIASLASQRPELAHDVLALDHAIDDMEVEIEENCLKLLALHQPVATDLRFIVASIKVNSTLERMGDLACNIARSSLRLGEMPNPIPRPELTSMAEQVRSMVSDCLKALVNLDANLARVVIARDDVIDAANERIINELTANLLANPQNSQQNIELMMSSRHLERIADQATNIAEDVVFMVEGEIIRHQHIKLEVVRDG